MQLEVAEIANQLQSGFLVNFLASYGWLAVLVSSFLVMETGIVAASALSAL